MERRDCFGSIKEINLNDGQTMTQSRPECRNCEEIRDCLRASKQIEEEKKERDEMRKQDMIAQIIDLSHIISNEIGSCLLEFLSRIYSSPLGTVLFKNFLLFYEVPRNSTSFNLTIPVSRKVMDLIRGEEVKTKDSTNPPDSIPRGGLNEGFTLRIVLLQRSFPNQPKANLGMIAYEVARAFASDDLGIKQILPFLSEVETNLLKKMGADLRTNWLIEKWGFMEEFEALKQERAVEK